MTPRKLSPREKADRPVRTRPRSLRVWRARVYFGWKTRRWPWQVPWQVVYIGRKRPPQSVIDYFAASEEERGNASP